MNESTGFQPVITPNFRPNGQTFIPAALPKAWREVFDALPDVVTVHDRSFNIVAANVAAQRQLHLPATPHPRMKCYRYYHGTECMKQGCPGYQCLRTGRPAVLETFEPKLGKFVEIRAIPHIDSLGRVSGVLHVVRDITRWKQSEQQLTASGEQLRNLTTHLQSVREEERKHIAREIHDELGQALTALKMDLFWMGKRLPDADTAVHEKTRSMLNLLENTARTVQRISCELRPGLLDDLGLQAAMEWHAQEFEERTGIPCGLSLYSGNASLDPERATTVFRIFQETLTNIMRHAEATRVQVTLEKQDGHVVMTVQDNGKGIDEKQITHPNSLGLIGIRERTRHWGGTVTIRGRSDEGTTVRVRIPLELR